MVLDETRDDDRAPVDPGFETIHVGFGAHYVLIRCGSAAASRELRNAFGTMVIDEPAGIEAGIVEAAPFADGIRIRGTAIEAPARIVSPQWAPREVYHEAIRLLIRTRDDLLWIHAGVAATNGRAHLFCGPSGQGKSTLVAALLELGWAYFSDELAAIDAEAALVHPFPLVPHRRVHDGEFVLLDEPDAVRGLRKVPVELREGTIASGPMALERVWFLDYRPTAHSVRESVVAPGASVLELLRNSLSVGTDRSREITRLTRLVSRVPTLLISYPSAAAAAAAVCN
jgi:hypothetical protein